ncbi:MAG: hypothetical protein ACJ8F2_26605, partial [Xanthobacteraceae bacterium]
IFSGPLGCISGSEISDDLLNDLGGARTGAEHEGCGEAGPGIERGHWDHVTPACDRITAVRQRSHNSC